MTDRLRPAVELEQEARAINATEPLPGMVKKRCSQCRYWFAVLVAEAEATSRCPDCAGLGSRPCQSGQSRLNRA